MSPQSALSDKSTTSTSSSTRAAAVTECKKMYSDYSNLSNSQIVQEVDVAFSHHKRLDLLGSNNLATLCNPLEDTSLLVSNSKGSSSSKSGIFTSSNRLQMRKRKKSFESAERSDHEATTTTNYYTDFVSGIFRDLSQAEESHDDSEEGAIGTAITANTDDDSGENHSHASQLLLHCRRHHNSTSLSNILLNETNCISDDESLLSRKRRKTTTTSNSTKSLSTSFENSCGNSSSSNRSQLLPLLCRNKKSFSCLRSSILLSGAATNGQMSKTTLPSATDLLGRNCTASHPAEDDVVSYQVSPVGHSSSRDPVKTRDGGLSINTAAASSDVTLDTATINNLVDKVLIESLVFPTLPPTVSESSCSSNNLTQTSVQAAQVNETSPHHQCKTHIEGVMHDSKDTYGWFVDMDLQEDEDRADVILAAQESVRTGTGVDEDLSFKAFTAPKKTTELDEEVEWAKAADTVDDVLGDFF